MNILYKYSNKEKKSLMYCNNERVSNKRLKINSECIVACCQGYLGTDVAEIDTNSLFGISKDICQFIGQSGVMEMGTGCYKM